VVGYLSYALITVICQSSSNLHRVGPTRQNGWGGKRGGDMSAAAMNIDGMTYALLQTALLLQGLVCGTVYR